MNYYVVTSIIVLLDPLKQLCYDFQVTDYESEPQKYLSDLLKIKRKRLKARTRTQSCRRMVPPSPLVMWLAHGNSWYSCSELWQHSCCSVTPRGHYVLVQRAGILESHRSEFESRPCYPGQVI